MSKARKMEVIAFRLFGNQVARCNWLCRLSIWKIEEKTGVHMLYKDLIYSGLVFGAERWAACLQRSCERIVCQLVTNSNSSVCELGGVIPPIDGKNTVMNLVQRMVNNFGHSLGLSNGHLERRFRILIWILIWIILDG